MSEKFDICVAVEITADADRALLLKSMESHARDLIGKASWLVRLRGARMLESVAWGGGPVQLQEGEVIAMYPRAQSAVSGAWLIEHVNGKEVWTLAVPASTAVKKFRVVTEVMWRMADVGQTCVAGREYSLGAVLRLGIDPIQELWTHQTLATMAVMRSCEPLLGWSVYEEHDERALVWRSTPPNDADPRPPHHQC